MMTTSHRLATFASFIRSNAPR